MATRRRRRSWYEVEPSDLRLWLYGPVPPGFWDLAENRLRYVEWLGNQLGFTQMEDWYRVTRRHFQRHRYLDWLGQQLGFQQPEDWYQLSTRQLCHWYGRSVLKKFKDSRVAILKEYLPEGDWKEWLFKKSPNGFWQQRANRRRYLDWLGQQLGFRRPEDWKRLRVADVLHHRGKGLLKQYQFRIEPLVREYLAGNGVPTTGMGSTPEGKRAAP